MNKKLALLLIAIAILAGFFSPAEYTEYALGGEGDGGGTGPADQAEGGEAEGDSYPYPTPYSSPYSYPYPYPTPYSSPYSYPYPYPTPYSSPYSYPYPYPTPYSSPYSYPYPYPTPYSYPYPYPYPYPTPYLYPYPYPSPPPPKQPQGFSCTSDSQCQTGLICFEGTCQSRAECEDGRDNDGDGKVDLADPGCLDSSDNDETDLPKPKFQEV